MFYKIESLIIGIVVNYYSLSSLHVLEIMEIERVTKRIECYLMPLIGCDVKSILKSLNKGHFIS